MWILPIIICIYLTVTCTIIGGVEVMEIPDNKKINTRRRTLLILKWPVVLVKEILTVARVKQ